VTISGSFCIGQITAKQFLSLLQSLSQELFNHKVTTYHEGTPFPDKDRFSPGFPVVTICARCGKRFMPANPLFK
jgi:hypothetical protein